MPKGFSPCFCPACPDGIEDDAGVGDLGVDFPAEFAGEGDAHQLAPAARDLAPTGAMSQGAERSASLTSAQDFARVRAGQDLAGEGVGDVFDRDWSPLRQMLRQPLEVVQLGDRGGDQEEEVLVAAP